MAVGAGGAGVGTGSGFVGVGVGLGAGGVGPGLLGSDFVGTGVGIGDGGVGVGCGIGLTGVGFGVGGVRVGTGSGFAGAGVGGGVGAGGVGAGGTGMGAVLDFGCNTTCGEENNDCINGNRAYSPAPLPATAALISRMVTMRLEFPSCFAGFSSVGVTGVSPNSQIVASVATEFGLLKEDVNVVPRGCRDSRRRRSWLASFMRSTGRYRKRSFTIA